MQRVPEIKPSLSLTIVPKIELLPRTKHTRSAENDSEESTHDVIGPMHPQLARGSGGGRPQNSEATKFFERDTEISFFAGEKLFVESAGSKKIVATGEEKRAGPKPRT